MLWNFWVLAENNLNDYEDIKKTKLQIKHCLLKDTSTLHVQLYCEK